MFRKKIKRLDYDKENKVPVIRCSICNGEQTAGFKDVHTGRFEDIMVIRDENDLKEFMELYGIDTLIEKEY